MTWWMWMTLGAFLLGAELFAIDVQFYLVFLGVSAALVGLAGLCWHCDARVGTMDGVRQPFADFDVYISQEPV